nr:MAG TPA: hypothetical protein [Caudoviricetes sp.]
MRVNRRSFEGQKTIFRGSKAGLLVLQPSTIYFQIKKRSIFNHHFQHSTWK